jgi:hypothetical protein
MNKPNATTLARLRTAAELRAAGLSWEAIAEKIGCHEVSCRRWTERYPDEWRRLLTRMEEIALRHAGNEALSILRRMAVAVDPRKAEDKRLAQRAAAFLFGKQREAKARWRRRQPQQDPLFTKYAPLIVYLESLDEAQRQAFIAHLAAGPAPQPGTGPTGEGGGASPPVAG